MTALGDQMMRRWDVLLCVGLAVTAGCKQREQVITPVAVPARVYESTNLKATVIRYAELGEAFKSTFLSGQKEGDVPAWWSVQTTNGVGVAQGPDFSAVPIASEVRYVQAETPLLATPDPRGKVVRTLTVGEKVEVATRPPKGPYRLVVAKGLAVGFVDMGQLDTAR